VGAEPAYYLISGESGQHDVEHDSVEVTVLSQLQTRNAVRGTLDDESLGRQPTPKCGNHPLLIIDQQNPHRASMGREERIASGLINTQLRVLTVRSGNN
jgi:hypothetical protein